MILADRTLARRLEGSDALAGANFAQALSRLRPGTAATAVDAAGGFAVYAGVGSPLTQAVGLGMDGAVREADLDRVEAFFRARGVLTEIEVCPLADCSLHEMLGARGYRVSGFNNVLVRRLDPRRSFSPPTDGIEIGRATTDETGLWARTVAQGLFAPEGPPPAMLGVFETMCHLPGAVPFLARVNGRIAGGGLVAIDQGLARLSGTSTLPDFRGRGVHRALVHARLGLATAERCDLAAVGAVPGSVSQRNVERRGFRVAYTRARMVLDHRGGSEMLLQY